MEIDYNYIQYCDKFRMLIEDLVNLIKIVC